MATGRYLQEKAPVLIVGPCGTGKSHLAQALGHCAVRQGVDVVFASCASLTQSLNAARATGAYERKLIALAKVPLLIIDDFGLKPLRAPFDEDLHDLISERYERTTASMAGVDPRELSFKHTVQLWTEWISRGLSAAKDGGRLFTLIAQCRMGSRPGRIEPRMRKRRPKPYPWLKIPRAQARRKIELHGHTLETK